MCSLAGSLCVSLGQNLMLYCPIRPLLSVIIPDFPFPLSFPLFFSSTQICGCCGAQHGRVSSFTCTQCCGMLTRCQSLTVQKYNPLFAWPTGKESFVSARSPCENIRYIVLIKYLLKSPFNHLAQINWIAHKSNKVFTTGVYRQVCQTLACWTQRTKSYLRSHTLNLESAFTGWLTGWYDLQRLCLEGTKLAEPQFIIIQDSPSISIVGFEVLPRGIFPHFTLFPAPIHTAGTMCGNKIIF